MEVTGGPMNLLRTICPKCRKAYSLPFWSRPVKCRQCGTALFVEKCDEETVGSHNSEHHYRSADRSKAE